MSLPDFTMRQLLESGVHFGHQVHRWNPKMSRYIFGERNGIHIIDLAQTVPLLHQALRVVSDVVAAGGRVLFVGTKRQATDSIMEAAKSSAQYCVNHRWLGGMLTNWKTVSQSIRRLRDLDALLNNKSHGFTKKEFLRLTREHGKLDRALSGIKDMGGLPNLLLVIDTNREQIAIKEARCLGIPVVAILDTNCDPDGITYPVPGNDDAARSIAFYCDIFARAALEGISRAQSGSGRDIGASVNPVAMFQELSSVVSESSSVCVHPSALAGCYDVFVRLSVSDGDPDNLKAISGIDVAIEQSLNTFGVYHYWQIAALTPADLEVLGEHLECTDLMVRNDWVQQAAALKKNKVA